MENPIEFYTKEKCILEEALEILKKKSRYLSLSRFIVFFAITFLIYFNSDVLEYALFIAFSGIL